ncbi:ATP-binding protein [Sphingorhabdus sp. EL138]|uniref:ATP-binding protein n=1 Tax=Sphingorhabdus sp. EL138 TaxID=2073156 RepID=UPI0013A59DD2|nr:ATP-binding protein [Sphingorhabdus sp. EL138]
MWSKHWPLSQQLASVLAVCLLVNAALIIGAVEFVQPFVERQILDELSPSAARAYHAFNSDKIPERDDIAALIVESKALRESENSPDTQVNLWILICVLTGSAVTFALSYALLGRLGHGYINVARAAQSVAAGDLSARARPLFLASQEEVKLARDFNCMAASLQRAERELADGTAAIAHELRTPLTILRGRLYGISDGIFSPGSKEVTGLIRQVEGLSRIVDDLQTLSLINSNQMKLDLKPVDLAEEVGHVLVTVAPDLEARGLRPCLELQPSTLIADSSRIRQVVSAVLSNSQRYAANSGILEIRTRDDVDESVLEIVDYGPGLPHDQTECAFDRFWRAEQSRARHTGGSGLGLAVVRAIVEAHGGRAKLRNHSLGGTVFEMYLPKSVSP